MNAIPLLYEDDGDVFYPVSDGEPMGESDLHIEELIYLLQAFQERFQEEADVHVSGDLFLYYQKGDPKKVVCPDLMVIQGIGKAFRQIYKLWQEREVPCLIVEVTSRSTWRKDLGAKKDRYESLGIAEYLLYDPEEDVLSPPLQGYRLVDGRYVPIRPEADGSLVSRTTGVTLRMEGERVRVVETASGRPLRRRREIQSALDTEAEARRAAEEEVARLRRELARSREG
jgi:Uma2 family endonuclease